MRRTALAAILLIAVVGAGFFLVWVFLAAGDSCVRVGEDLVVAADAGCSGDAVAIGGNLLVQGTVGGSAIAIGGAVRVRGVVAGNVVGVGGEVVLQDGARIGGNVVSFGGEFGRTPAATVRGHVLESAFLPQWTVNSDRPAIPLWARLGVAVLVCVLALGVCLLLTVVVRSAWPQRTGVMVETLKGQLLESIGVGISSSILLAVLLPLLSVLLLLLVIGIPLIPVLYLLWGLFCLGGLSIAGLAAGEALFGRNGTLPQWGVSALGLVVVVPVVVLPAVFFPLFGLFWAVLISGAAAGAIVVSRIGTLRWSRVHRRGHSWTDR